MADCVVPEGRTRRLVGGTVGAIVLSVLAACDEGASPPAGVPQDSLRATAARLDPALADQESGFSALHAYPGVSRVWVEVPVDDAWNRYAVLEIDLAGGTVRRIAPDPAVVSDLSSRAWVRHRGAVVARADGAPVIVQRTSIDLLPAPGAVIVPAAPVQLPEEASRHRHGGVDEWSSHVGNVQERDRRSPDGRHLLVAMTREQFAASVAIHVLDLRTGVLLEPDPRLVDDHALGSSRHRVDACFWTSDETFVLALWRYEGDVGRKWLQGTITDGGVAIESWATPDPDQPFQELRGMIGAHQVFRRVVGPDGSLVAGAMVGPWAIRRVDPDGTTWSPILVGTSGELGLFEAKAFDASGQVVGTSLLVVQAGDDPGDPDGLRTEWIDLEPTAEPGLWTPSRGAELSDAVPDPRSGPASDAWLLLHEREGLLELGRDGEGSWRVRRVSTRPAGDGSAGTPGVGGQ